MKDSDIPKNLKIEYVPIDILNPAAYNPRKISPEDYADLKESIELFGMVDPIIVNGENPRQNVVIGGHQRLKVAADLGIANIPVVYCYLSESQERELNIRLNKNNGEWDWEVLEREFSQDDLENWGFDAEELMANFSFEDDKSEGGSGDGKDKDKIPEPPKKAKTKPGDLYQLGEHRLLCGDSRNAADVKRLLGDEIPVLMVTDPPYGVDYKPDWREELFKRDEKAIGEEIENDDIERWFDVYKLFPGAVAYVWHASWFTDLVLNDLYKAGFEMISMIIWNKHHFAISRGNYHWKHEPCWYVVRNGEKHNWQGARDQSTVWDIASLNAFGKKEERFEHPNQKPFDCMARPILNNSKIGQGVYDPFGGSGTTLIACQSNKRICFTMEVKPAFCDVIVERWEAFTGLKAVLLSE